MSNRLKKQPYNHIELFAGCGGMTLGLERAKFKLVFANELSPMAAETFAYNILGEDLAAKSKAETPPVSTIWISSLHKSLESRLRENPFDYPLLGDGYSDTFPKSTKGKPKLLVGNITHLNQALRQRSQFVAELQSIKNGAGIDLVSGGPPCQSFSMAGLRQKDSDKNSLPWEFANFVDIVKPKIALLENVTGILRPFTDDGKPFYAWFEVAKAFSSKGYIPLCLHLNARNAGVPQNRPRFILIAVRNDYYKDLKPHLNTKEKALFAPSEAMMESVLTGRKVKYGAIDCIDITSTSKASVTSNTFLKNLNSGSEISVRDAIGDLKYSEQSPPSEYVESLSKSYSTLAPNTLATVANHELRRNSDLVKRRFRIYQVLDRQTKPIKNEITALLSGKADSLTAEAWGALKPHSFLKETGTMSRFRSAKELSEFLKRHPTKKRSQKALDANKPAQAALSIPDDVCHYDENELRTLTVREMARIQSFPDSFVFRSKVTTGGKMRRFEVPQYTQVGNAVPPNLGFELGNSIADLLSRT